MGWESFDVVRFDLAPLIQAPTGKVQVKNAYNLPIVGPRGLQGQTNYLKSWAGNLLMWSDLALGAK